MIFADVGPVYIKIAILIKKIGSKFDKNFIFDSIQEFLYLKSENIIELNNFYFIPISLNSYKNNFLTSKEYSIFLQFIEIEKINQLYLSCKVSNEVELIFKQYFSNLTCKRIENTNTTSLLISAINCLTSIKTNLFEIPGQELINLYKVGHELNKPKKEYINMNVKSLYPFLLANIREGLSLYRVDSLEKFNRVGGGTIGATTYWSLVKLICGYSDPEEAVNDAIMGKNENIDLTVGDIYGGDYKEFGLESGIIAAGFGKIKNEFNIENLQKQDISRSLLTMLCINLVQLSTLWAKKENLSKVIIVGNPFECLEFMQMVQMAINYFSQGKIKTYFTDFSVFLSLIGLHEKIMGEENNK